MAFSRALIRSGGAFLALLAALAGWLEPMGAPRAAAADLASDLQAQASTAASHGVDQYIAVIDRSTGKFIATTPNAHQTVASESIVKLFIAVWWLHQTNGNASAVGCGDIGYMIRVSDNAVATSCWRDSIVSDVSGWYGLVDSSTDPSSPSYWGATRVSAADIATLLYRAGEDPLVSPWLMTQMLDASDVFADGSDQNYGFNALDGAGSKQGWGSDASWMSKPMMVHSAGYVGNVAAAILQAGGSDADSDQMESSATATAQDIAAHTVGTSAAIDQEYARLGRLGGSLGYPVSAARKVPGGSYQVFQNGRIYSSASGSFAVEDGLLARYLSGGNPAGDLGWPTGDGQGLAGGTQQVFQKGRIYWTSATGARAVKGAVLARYLARGGPAGALGWPTAEQTDSVSGTHQKFRHGTIDLTVAQAHAHLVALVLGAAAGLGLLALFLVRLRTRRMRRTREQSPARRAA